MNVGSESFEPIVRRERSNVTDGRDEAGEDPFSGQVERTRGGWSVQYEERPQGPEGQFGF